MVCVGKLVLPSSVLVNGPSLGRTHLVRLRLAAPPIFVNKTAIAKLPCFARAVDCFEQLACASVKVIDGASIGELYLRGLL